jgi:hypothetical protein
MPAASMHFCISWLQRCYIVGPASQERPSRAGLESVLHTPLHPRIGRPIKASGNIEPVPYGIRSSRTQLRVRKSRRVVRVACRGASYALARIAVSYESESTTPFAKGCVVHPASIHEIGPPVMEFIGTNYPAAITSDCFQGERRTAMPSD